jgi:CspA family cold shock protein
MKGPGDRALFIPKGISMATGVVRSFNNAKGFGLIAPDLGGPPLFAHQSAIVSPGVKKLAALQRVEYEVEERPEGLSARNIKTLKD